jgi:formylglycine-generating enzyme required for sulfatase activity
MRIIKRIIKLALMSLLTFFIIYPILWMIASTGVLGEVEFGYYADANIVKHAIEKGEYTESLGFGMHTDLTLEDFRAFVYTKAKWKITFAFWQEMNIQQVCENPQGIFIQTPADKVQVYDLEYLSEALQDRKIQLRNIRDVIRHFDDIMFIVEANHENSNSPLFDDFSREERRQYLHITWGIPWNTKSIDQARERLIAHLIERQKQSAGELQNYEFETVKLDAKGNIIEKKKQQAKSYYEKLDDSIILEMVEIPEGNFLMGLSNSDAEKIRETYRNTSEHVYMDWLDKKLIEQMPQHSVTVPEFYIGKFEITQGQWNVVTKLPKINRELLPFSSLRKDDYALNHKKDDYLPIKNVLYEDAIEFCERLSQFTGKEYRLPSEAEWEYACRGGTTSLFHTGDTITSDYANVSGSYGYAPWSIDRDEWIPVGVLGFANNFGLYDMHGNVEEWCLDTWHDSYYGVPTNGSAWMNDSEPDSHVQRGGSCFGSFFDCLVTWRERSWENRQNRDEAGFRVIVMAKDKQAAAVSFQLPVATRSICVYYRIYAI